VLTKENPARQVQCGSHSEEFVVDKANDLFAAIRTGDLAGARTLVDANPALANAKNEQGQSAVLAAVYSGQSAIRDMLIERSGADNLELHEAVAAGQFKRVKHLVDANPDLSRSSSPDGFPIFALACAFGHLEIAQYLFEMGSLVSAAATNGTGYNGLTGAVAGGRTVIADWLLQNGADPNYRYGAGYTPLLTAAANGHLEIVKLLLLHGADVHAKTNDGKSAVAMAEDRKHSEVAEFLRSKGAA
jgi:ankyrin repeat protein